MKILPVLLISILIACSPQKRLNRLIDHHPELNTVDTLIIRDTVLIPTVRLDTGINIANLLDTVYITEDRLKIKTILVNDTLYIEGECEGDTIIKEHIVYVDKVKYVEQDYVAKYWKWGVGLFLFLIIFLIAKRLSR
jgi:hypothetical protein